MPIENVVVIVVLVGMLVAGLALLTRPRHRKPDGVIHIIRRDSAGRWVDEAMGFYDPPKKRRKPPTP